MECVLIGISDGSGPRPARIERGSEERVELFEVDLFTAALSKKCDQILAFLRLRDQEIHVIAKDERIRVGKPFIQACFVPCDV